MIKEMMGAMKMKRLFTICLITILLIVLTACSSKTGTTKILSKEGVAPYALSESDTDLLRLLGLEKDTNIISFKAPKEARSVKVNAYVLDEDGTWQDTGGGAVLLSRDADPNDNLEGEFTMMLKENYAVDFSINMKGRSTFKTNALDVDQEVMASSIGFLTEFQEIEINKEIPVAMMIYNHGTSMKSFALSDFYSPSAFEGMDLVQVVTLTFTDESN